MKSYKHTCLSSIRLFHWLYCRSDKDSLNRLGKSFSLQSRRYRAKRINVNIQVNCIAYLAEVLGGLVVSSLGFASTATYMYIGTQLLYGNVIPSCYLMNNDYQKISILKHGWVFALTSLYKNRKSDIHPERNKSNKHELEAACPIPERVNELSQRGKENVKIQIHQEKISSINKKNWFWANANRFSYFQHFLRIYLKIRSP